MEKKNTRTSLFSRKRLPVFHVGNGLGLDKTGDEEDRIRFDETAGCTEGNKVQASSLHPTKTNQRLPELLRLLRMPDSPQLDHPPALSSDQQDAATAAANAGQSNLVPSLKPTMIIKRVLGRYERWNPVHPTAGAFWGVGLGLGCGVGWGPGFGPEVIGYVGAGCGVGFSVGFTLAGVGIGLPQHVLVKSHHHDHHSDVGFPISITSLESARYYTLTIIRGLVWDAINYASHVVTSVRKESGPKLLMSQDNSPQVSGGVDLPKLGKGLSSSIQSTVECIRAFKDQHWPP